MDQAKMRLPIDYNFDIFAKSRKIIVYFLWEVDLPKCATYPFKLTLSGVFLLPLQ